MPLLRPLAMLLLALCTSAQAAPDEIQVYTDDINAPGEFGLELHTNYVAQGASTPAWPEQKPVRHMWRFTPEFSYGLSPSWELGFYLPMIRDAAGQAIEERLSPALLRRYRYDADAIAASVAVGIESAQLLEQQREQFIETVTTLARTVEMRDQYTGDHTKRVTDYSLLLANEMNLSANEKYQIQIGTPLHDIGKIGIRQEKLNKPGKLSPEEVAMFQTHPAKGKRILEPIPFMADLIPGAFCHHESWDGNGYPQSLMGENIPLIGRIVAIADSYDAMTSDRAYRKAMPHETAISEIERCSGVQFDQRLVDVFLGAIDEFRESGQHLGH